MESHRDVALTVLTVGLIVVSAGLIGTVFRRMQISPLVGLIGLGLLLRLGDNRFGFLGEVGSEALAVLAGLAIAVLLFRVGLESNLGKLLEELGSSLPIWAGNVLLSAALTYAAARWVLGLGQLPAVVVAIALAATSIGVGVAVWEGAGALSSRQGQRFLDVAELDDLSGVVALGILLAVLPQLTGGGEAGIGSVASAIGYFALLTAAFSAVCYLVYRFGEPRLGEILQRAERPPHPMLSVLGLGLILAAMAALLGLALAIGAFFAGLVFSRDPERIHEEAGFRAIYELFTPFFFVYTGFLLAPGELLTGAGIGVVLLAAGVLGKLIGTMTPALLNASFPEALTLGVSMIPRAEITLIVAQQARAAGAISDQVFAAVVFVVAATAISAPTVLDRLLRRS